MTIFLIHVMIMCSQVMREITGTTRHGVGSEHSMMIAWQRCSMEAEKCVDPVDNLRDKSLHTNEWEGFYARVEDILRKDLELHVVEMGGKHIRKDKIFEVERDGKKVMATHNAHVHA